MSMRRLVAVIGLFLCAVLCACASGQTGGAPRARATSAQHQWENATYRLTCDGVVPGEFTARLVNGSTRVVADVGLTPYYDDFDVRVEAAVTGDLAGDRRPDTVVLLQ